MPAFRCIVQYSLCAFTSYGFATAAAQVPVSPNSHHARNAAPIPDGPTTVERGTIAEYPLDAGLVTQVLGEVQHAGFGRAHPATTISPCSGGTHCGTIVVTGSYNPGSGGGGGGSGGPPASGSPPPNHGNSGQSCFAPLQPANRANQSQIFSDEGGARTTGYQPTPGSGVTVAAGVDLSKTDAQEMQSFGVPQSIIDYLKPWMVPASQVQATVDRIGWPTLSASNAQTISVDIFNGVYNQVAGYFNAQTTKGFAFDTFPKGVQSAIVDAAYPNGPHLWEAQSAYARAMWADALAGNWVAVENEFKIWQVSGKVPYRYQWDANDIAVSIRRHRIPSNDAKGECPPQSPPSGPPHQPRDASFSSEVRVLENDHDNEA